MITLNQIRKAGGLLPSGVKWESLRSLKNQTLHHLAIWPLLSLQPVDQPSVRLELMKISPFYLELHG